MTRATHDTYARERDGRWARKSPKLHHRATTTTPPPPPNATTTTNTTTTSEREEDAVPVSLHGTKTRRKRKVHVRACAWKGRKRCVSSWACQVWQGRGVPNQIWALMCLSSSVTVFVANSTARRHHHRHQQQPRCARTTTRLLLGPQLPPPRGATKKRGKTKNKTKRPAVRYLRWCSCSRG